MKKKILSLFIIFCIIFSSYSVVVAVEDEISNNDISASDEKVQESDSTDNTEEIEEEEEKKPEVKINKTSSTIVVGKTVQLSLSNTTLKPKWSTTKKSVATVSSGGTVKGIKAGTATITAKLDGKTYTCKVKVEKPVINYTSRTLLIDTTSKMSFSGTTLTPTWKSTNTSIATIDSKGNLKAKKKGSATIKGTVGGVTYSCKIKVEDPYLSGIMAKNYVLGAKSANPSKL